MLDTLKVLLDILRLKAGPEDLPSSTPLLWGSFVLLVGLQGTLAAWLLPQESDVLPQAALSGLVTMGWLAALLRLFGHPERFVQTATAIVGVACLFAPVSVPLLLAIRPDLGQPAPLSPLTLVAFALSLYVIYINARILRAAIERPLFQCVLLFLLGEMVVFAANLAAGFGADAGVATPT